MSKHKAPGGRQNSRRPSNRSRTSAPAARTTRAKPSSQAIAARHRTPIARLLNAPELGALVPRLPPETLHALVHQAGLHACGDLIAAATPAQLTSVLDLDLWQRGRPGQDEHFDPHRFGEWLEVLAETGASVSARVVAALDQDLVVAGLSRHIRVFDPAAIAVPASIDDDERPDVDGIPHDGPECELGGYLVRGRGSSPWDAIVAVLTALDDEYQACFHAVMRGCRQLSNSTPEIDGLDELFTAPQQQIHDVAVMREHRRSDQGYIAPADARAFLDMARHRTVEDRAQFTNPIAAAYFRAAGKAGSPAEDSQVVAASRSLDAPRPSASHAHAVDAIDGLLAETGVVRPRPLGSIAAAAGEPSPVAAFRRVMAYASDKDENAYFARSG